MAASEFEKYMDALMKKASKCESWIETGEVIEQAKLPNESSSLSQLVVTAYSNYTTFLADNKSNESTYLGLVWLVLAQRAYLELTSRDDFVFFKDNLGESAIIADIDVNKLINQYTRRVHVKHFFAWIGVGLACLIAIVALIIAVKSCTSSVIGLF